MNKFFSFAIVLILICSITADDVFTSQSGNKYSTNRLIVKLQPQKEMPKSELIKNVHHLFLQTYVVYTSDLHALEDVLQKSENVNSIERDFHSERKDLARNVTTIRESEVASPFNDPRVGSLWSFADAGENGISVNKVYQEKSTKPQSEIIVAVVDTGVDVNHEDLRNVVWNNPGEIAGNGIDDDQNGYIDDINGINTLVRDKDGKATVDVSDTHSHGTHVSGTIAAQQNNSTGVAGIASKVKIMAIRTVPNASDEKDVDVVEAFMYAAKNGAKIINCSFGKAHNEGGNVVAEAIDFIGKEYGVLVVAAAGNSSQNIDIRPTYPASFTSENLLVVASTTSRGAMSYFSNYGKKGVDIAAPGSSIFSTVPRNRYSSMSGTSMASPTVAGVAAEVLANNPSLDPVALKSILMNSVTKVSAFSSKVVSGGRIDLKKALIAAKAQQK
ncbi:S8 family peptidase [Candidatus Uabimicrobium sp. HlEnr_7]|uniref:S8 family peptidase n=1 Tax=Candidatus Uabimicrobium helgolandensis TaxID=3095367 RepID=UPI0035562D7E